MSNPGVRIIIDKLIAGKSFRIEDNIGEAIHIHWGDIRVNLTIEEFYKLAEEMLSLANEMLKPSNLNVDALDPIYFNEQGYNLCTLERAEIDEVALEELLTEFYLSDGSLYLDSIRYSRFSKAFAGDKKELLNRKQYNLGYQSNEERMWDIYNSIKEHGYPYRGRYIILHNDGCYVRDGCHRASCLYQLYGNITVPVMRLYLRGESSDEAVCQMFEQKKRWCLVEREIALSFVSTIIPSMLKEKKVVIRGAGDTTRELLKLWEGKVDIRAVIAKENKGIGQEYDFIEIEEAIRSKYDCIVIASRLYRNEMMAELEVYKDQIEVMDIYGMLYEHNIDTGANFYDYYVNV